VIVSFFPKPNLLIFDQVYKKYIDDFDI
jgi:hypothetical protein